MKDKYPLIMSTNTMGAQDLDTRPPEMMRSTISFWVEKCPHCGYCAADVAKLIKNAKETMQDEAYKTQLANSAYPELANKFLCRMILEDKAEEYKAAIYSAICAGWACDDARNAAAAAEAREISIKRIHDLNNRNDHYVKQTGGDELLLADMLRRNGQFGKAKESIEKGLSLASVEIIKSILTFERELVEKQDISVHQVSEAVKK